MLHTSVKRKKKKEGDSRVDGGNRQKQLTTKSSLEGKYTKHTQARDHNETVLLQSSQPS